MFVHLRLNKQCNKKAHDTRSHLLTFSLCFFAVVHVVMVGDVSTLVVRDNRVRTPSGIAMNHKQNCFYVANYDAHTIVKITAAGTLPSQKRKKSTYSYVGMISMFAGSGKQGNADGVGANASFCRPYGIAIDQHTGNLFVSECSNHLIRKITPEGMLNIPLYLSLSKH